MVPGVGATGGGLGDLIEMQDDAFEIGDEEDDRGRPREGLTVPMVSTERSASRGKGFQSSRKDFNLVLRERSRKADSRKTD